MKLKNLISPAAAAMVTAMAIVAAGAPANAQDAAETAAPPQGPPESVFDENWVSIGLGLAYTPSYSGSDDYVVSPLPVIQGSVGGIDIQPRPAGLAIDLIKDPQEGPGFSFGPTIRLRNDRADQTKDVVVQSAGELKRAVEIGPAFGVSFPKLLNPYDSLTISADVRWDVAGAHRGMSASPGVTYFTPLNQGMIASLSLGAEYASDEFANYYFSVSPAQSLASGLPVYGADGGFTKASATMLVGVDLDGNALNGGLGVIVIGGYSRMLGDAKDTPFTSLRGSADQFFVGAGLGYTF